MNPLIKKLRILAGQRLIILNPPDGYLQALGELPEGVELSEEASGEFDFVHFFAKDSKEVEEFAPRAVTVAKEDAIFWVSYPKRSSKIETDITRDFGWDYLNANGLRPVSQVSIDATWSALRFRPFQKVKSRR